MRARRKQRSSKAQPVRHWTPLQKVLGYTLLVLCFLSVLTYVSQGIEVKNIAYAMQNLIREKRCLLEEKQRLQLALLEQQSFDRVESLIEQFGLPLEPGPRLEVVLRESDEHPLPLDVSPTKDEADSWRGWLARMNQAQAMVSLHPQRPFGWRPPIGKRVGRPPAEAESEQR